jgi:non-lysosomal glucosylceramidase
LVEEGLAIVAGLRARYDGERRNPWNEMECGSHYSRSLASWTLLLALSGFECDLTTGHIGFRPVLDHRPFRCFWSTGTGWGVYEQSESGVTLRCDYGHQVIKTFRTGSAEIRAFSLNDTLLDAQIDGAIAAFTSSITLSAGESLTGQS